jgi:hypothetical protein
MEAGEASEKELNELNDFLLKLEEKAKTII